MAKRSPIGSPLVCEKYQSDCTWGLMSIFHFGQGRFNRKLLSNGRQRHANRRPADATGHSRRRLNLQKNLDKKSKGITDRVENKTPTVDTGKAIVKRLKEGEVSTRQHLKKQINSANHGHKAFQTPDHGQGDAMATGRWHSHSSVMEKSSDVLDSAATTQKFCNDIHLENGRDHRDKQKSVNCVVKYDRLNEINMQLVEMNEAVEAFINQKFMDGKFLGKDGANQQSKQFSDALMTLNSNKELFLKLLRDPNSLLAKHIQDMRHSQAGKEQMKSSSKTELSNFENSKVRHCGEPALRSQKCQKQNTPYLFWKKSQNNYPLEGSGNSPTSNRMVGLKPDLAAVHNSVSKGSQLSSKGNSAAPAKFSFGDIRRKFKHAMGERKEEQLWIPMNGDLHKFPGNWQGSEVGGKGIDGVIAETNAPCRTYIDEGRAPKPPINIKRINGIGKLETFQSSRNEATECACKNLHLSTVKHSNQRDSDIYVEAKKRISEMLTSGGKDGYSARKQVPRRLGRILSLPEYDFLPASSPVRDNEHCFNSAQMALTPNNNFRIGNKNNLPLQYERKTGCQDLLRKNAEVLPCTVQKKHKDQKPFDFLPNISENIFSLTEKQESNSSPRDGSKPKGDANILQISLNPNCKAIVNAKQRTDAGNICEKIGNLECLIQDLPAGNQTSTVSSYSSSPNASSIEKAEDLDSIKDKMEQPSPVSILEPFFVEDISSPETTTSKPAEPPRQRLPINFEQHSPTVLSLSSSEISSCPCTEDWEFIHQHVMAVLQDSGLYCDELSVKWHSSNQQLDQSLFDEAQLFPTQSYNDRKLLCDCISEVFLEVYQNYFGCSPWISSTKPMIWSVIVQKNVVREVIKGVNQHLLPQMPPHTLEQLVAKDLAKPGTWMDIRIDAEDTVIEMLEAILDELIMENLCELQT
ncbi:uncharacterized protein LOC131164820 [Malania oleifera]|uniref:uncharacterized protein LOC131164820 n=1 Tax=Malania oleifera TaxID=397392 RepID=UPI0025AE87B3|nr:uncharacterized protein LOC131164820 [Malania oleifera]XP_057978290.1 uncharacterized protein LOC131164820 [Malania oleifera]